MVFAFRFRRLYVCVYVMGGCMALGWGWVGAIGLVAEGKIGGGGGIDCGGEDSILVRVCSDTSPVTA